MKTTLMTLLAAFFVLLAVLLVPHEAWAWGPITHIDFAYAALQNVAAYPAMVKALLTACPYDFLYGALAADITLGKDYVDYVHNCHNWRVGFLIFNEAREKGTERQQASALGYLSHLAVDIISHNYYVPYKTIRSYPTRTLGHVYWEMRYDAKRPKKMWNLARELGRMNFEHNDELFERMVRRTLFSFKTNRRIFRSVLNLHRISHWQTMMEKLHDRSRFKLAEKDIDDYRSLAVESVVSFLKDPEKAPCTHVDPTGEAKLLYAGEMRQELKRLTRRRMITGKQADEFLKRAKHALKATIYKPGDLPTGAEIFMTS